VATYPGYLFSRLKEFMKTQFIAIALSVTGLLTVANPGFAADAKATAPQPAASKAVSNKTSAAPASKASASKFKADPSVKLVNLNAATREELMKLPGISAVEADKIIAARPYGSKGMLVSKNVLSTEKALEIKDLVEAGKTYKNAKKNAALYNTKK
jgi:DNA uptake protein ComE-like DNA-binding protein